jgi:type VI protein secretion system component Hcp
MKFLCKTIAVLSVVIYCNQAKAQGFFVKATSSKETLTRDASPEEATQVQDARHGSGPHDLTDFTRVSKFGFDTEQVINLSNQGPVAGGISLKPFTITKIADLSSPRFFVAQTQGTLLTLEILTMADFGLGDRNVAHKIILRDAAVSTVTVDTNEGCHCLEESITFEYGTIEIYPYTINSRREFSAGTAVGWNSIVKKAVNP